jgi:hypothetical protein
VCMSVNHYEFILIYLFYYVICRQNGSTVEAMCLSHDTHGKAPSNALFRGTQVDIGGVKYLDLGQFKVIN